LGLLDTSLQIGRSAIQANSLAMDVVGNNIANAATEGYARRQADLRSIRGVRVDGLYQGLGVSAERILRISDSYLEERLRDARSALESITAQDEGFQRLEGIFNELTDTDLSSVINQFFDALNTLQGSPEEPSVRRAVIEAATTLTEAVTHMRDKIDELRTSLDSEIAGSVDTINNITREVASLNVEIARIEGGGMDPGGAGALRDRRDLLLSQLADTLDLRVVDTGSGMANVFAGPDPLVLGSHSYDVTTEISTDRGVAVHTLVFASDGREVAVRGGRIEGLIEARDTGVAEFADMLDEWAGAFIEGFNRVHSSGVGLKSYGDVTGTNGVDDPLAALNAAGLDFAPATGTFDVTVRSVNSGEERTYRFHVDLDGLNGDDTTLASLAAEMTAALAAQHPQISASVGPGNTLRISSSAPELTFTFGDDTSGALAALGVNTFFTGSDGRDFAVADTVMRDPSYIAAGLTSMAGDNANVTRMLAFQTEPIGALDGVSVDSFYQGIVATLAARAAAVKDRHIGLEAIKGAVESQREAMSGVSLDEEAVKLIRYQTGYAAAARFISTVDQLLKVLLNM
jgi:flagellar hook-associated protein 1 FlgK